ncbi:MAG: metal ABC transporter permease [Chloroflexota bacterium]|nr:metal ABC transporter permease [Chloroflexota bacterium]
MIEALQYEFMRNALYAGLLAAVACGIIGTYVVVKRMAFISGGIAHASFGGIGLGYYLAQYLSWITPVIGALFFTVLSALGMGLVVKRTRLAEDTAIGIMWSLGMAIGIIFIGLTPGYAPDLFGYLFGNILTVPQSDLIMMIALDAVIIGVVAALYKEFFALSFDQEFGTSVGIPTERLYLTLLCLIALTVVLLIRVVGIILVIALLTIPAATARQYTHSLWKMMMLSIIVGIVSVAGGLWLSYELDLASGATIILVSGSIFILSTVFSRLRRRKPEYAT